MRAWLVTGALVVLGLAAAVLTALQKLDLHGGGSLTVILAVAAAATAFAETRLRDRARTRGEEAARHGDREDQGLTRKVEAARRDLLAEVRRIWVQAEADDPQRIEIGLTERPTAVAGTTRTVFRQPEQADRPLERGLEAGAVFRQLGRRLLILGEPGSGKTTLLIELTRTLLDAAEADPAEPVPVVFALSAWAPNRLPLVDWMIEELYRTYGVTRRLARP